MTSITQKTHPNLTPAERRAARATQDRNAYRLVRSELRLRRKSDGKPGKIEFVLVYPPSADGPYTVRLRRNGDPCRCSCMDYARRLERDGAAVGPCKHMLMIGQDARPPETEEALKARLEQARQDRQRPGTAPTQAPTQKETTMENETTDGPRFRIGQDRAGRYHLLRRYGATYGKAMAGDGFGTREEAERWRAEAEQVEREAEEKDARVLRERETLWG